MSLKLSIIIPFYNMADTLSHTLDSMLNQTLSADSYEIIAVDDSSVDDTFSVLKEYESAYPGRIRVLKTPHNLRQGGARNLGIKEALGEWTGFMDGDDYAHPQMFEKMVAAGEASGADVVGCGLWEVTDYDYSSGLIKNGNTKDQSGILNEDKYKSLILNPCSMITKIYKSDVIRKHNLQFPEGIFYEDNAAAPIWMLHFSKFELLEEPLYYYYQKPGSTTHTITVERCLDRMEAGELLIKLADEHGFLQKYPREFEAAFTKLYYVNTLFSYLLGCKENDVAFLTSLREGIIKYFPEFRNNLYYEKSYDKEQKKLINMHISNPRSFIIYYRLLSFYRRLRYGKP